MRVDIISIFPEYFAPLDVSLVGKARERGILEIHLHQLRDWTRDVHKTVDDTPYGGPRHGDEAGDLGRGHRRGDLRRPVGAGRTGRGATDDRADAERPAVHPGDGHRIRRRAWLLFTPARYEGIDSRVAAEYGSRLRVDEVSIGDYVLAGGEAAVLVIVEAVGRLLPGVLGNARSVADDSFAPGPMANLLEGPVYTKPPVWRGHEVPEILLSGHHGRSPAGGVTRPSGARWRSGPSWSPGSIRPVSTRTTGRSWRSSRPLAESRFARGLMMWQTKTLLPLFGWPGVARSRPQHNRT